MIRRASLLIFPLLLSACVSAGHHPEQVRQIAFASQTYVLEEGPGGWQIQTPEGPVPCRATTETDCYWSLRAHLVVQDADDNKD